MGWGNCGKDSKGRNIGYVFPATCDYEGCDAEIDRGLAYVCGRMHGEDGYSCEGYFCHKHKNNSLLTPDDEWLGVCDSCMKQAIANGYDEEEEKWIEQ